MRFANKFVIPETCESTCFMVRISRVKPDLSELSLFLERLVVSSICGGEYWALVAWANVRLLSLSNQVLSVMVLTYVGLLDVKAGILFIYNTPLVVRRVVTVYITHI